MAGGAIPQITFRKPKEESLMGYATDQRYFQSMPLRVESLLSNLLLSYTHSGNKTVISGVMPQDSRGYPFEGP